MGDDLAVLVNSTEPNRAIPPSAWPAAGLHRLVGRAKRVHYRNLIAITQLGQLASCRLYCRSPSKAGLLAKTEPASLQITTLRSGFLRTVRRYETSITLIWRWGISRQPLNSSSARSGWQVKEVTRTV